MQSVHCVIGDSCVISAMVDGKCSPLVTVTNDRSEARVDPLAALFVQGQTGKYQAEVSRAT